MELFIFKRAYIRWEICATKLIGLIVGRQIKKSCVTVPFLLCFILYFRAISTYKPPRAYIRRGDLTGGGFFCVTSLGVYTWRGLFSEFYFIYSF